MNDQNDLVHDLAAFAVATSFADLPDGAVDKARKGILDTIGVMLAATGREPRVAAVLGLVAENGGAEESSIFGTGQRVPAAAAAFANGTLAHALDFDSMTPWGAHADSSIVPAVLALAEKRGGVTGKELITAVAIGEELFIRLITNVGWKMDWNLSTVVGAFSTAAAAGSVMKLGRERMVHALGLASTHASGTMEQIFGIGSDMRGMYAGFNAQGCVNDVLLAQRGMRGVPALFEGPAGFFNVYFKGDYNRAGILADLGRDFLSAKMLYKYWPAVGTAFTHVHAAIELLRENAVELPEIEEVRVFVGDFHQRMCVPIEARRRPELLIDAKFSLPFLIGLTLAKGNLKIADFSIEALSDPQVLALAQKVVPVPDPSFDWKGQLPAGKVEFVLRDGRRLSRLGGDMPGTLERPLSWDQLAAKFRECAQAAAKPLSGETITHIINTTSRLEDVHDVRTLIELAC